MIAAPKDPVVWVDHVTKTYGPRRALDDICFTVRRGDKVGILGRNGAGKSTLLRLLLRLSTPTSGTLCVAGQGERARTSDVARCVGYVAQESMFDYRATPRSELHFQARLFGMSRSQALQRSEELLALVGLEMSADNRISTLSGGNRRRLDLAMGQLHSPELIILDEPTQGLDVQSRIEIWAALDALNAAGVTILFSTHDMAEAEQHARRLLIIQEGRIIADDTTEAICASHQMDMMILALGGPIDETSLLNTARPFSSGEPWLADRKLFIPMRDAQKDGLRAAEGLRAAGATIAEFQIKRRSLEAAYLAISRGTIDKWSANQRAA